MQPGAGARAQRRLIHIERAILALADHPCRHPREPHGWREFTVEEHRVRYRASRDTGQDKTAGNVLVLRVFGPGKIAEGRDSVWRPLMASEPAGYVCPVIERSEDRGQASLAVASPIASGMNPGPAWSRQARIRTRGRKPLADKDQALRFLNCLGESRDGLRFIEAAVVLSKLLELRPRLGGEDYAAGLPRRHARRSASSSACHSARSSSRSEKRPTSMSASPRAISPRISASERWRPLPRHAEGRDEPHRHQQFYPAERTLRLAKTAAENADNVCLTTRRRWDALLDPAEHVRKERIPGDAEK